MSLPAPVPREGGGDSMPAACPVLCCHPWPGFSPGSQGLTHMSGERFRGDSPLTFYEEAPFYPGGRRP